MIDEQRQPGEAGHIEDHNLLHGFYNRHDHITPAQEGDVLVFQSGRWTPTPSVQLSIVSVLPVASASMRGRMVFVEGAAGQPDEVWVCKRLADGAHAWMQFA